MIACVSPTEYNISETTNTLQYANRARNIKNKAELNEVEVGWEDVDYLQTLVTKLRRELSVLKGAKGANGLSALQEIGNDKEVMEWQDKHAQLRQQFAKLTAEKVNLEQKLASTPKDQAHDSAAFLAAAEPIVIEYEKTIDMLEGEKNLIKAALSQLEDMVEENEQTIQEQSQVISANQKLLQERETLISELEARLATVQDRGRSAESYLQELENKLSAYTSKGDSEALVVSELRKEVISLKQSERSTEAYVKEVETRLAKSDETELGLKRQIDLLEKDVASKEQSYRDLQARDRKSVV